MATVKKRFTKGIVLKPDTDALESAEGEIKVDSADNKLKTYLGAASREIVTSSQSQTITNKTVVVASNTITTAASGNLAATELNAALAELQSDIDTRATATGLSDHLSDTTDAHDASAISNIPAGNLAATDVQAALNELQGDIDTNTSGISDHLSDTSDAHDASAISSVPSGNLAATDVQGALNELQSDIDNRALSSALTDHINDTSDAHDASAISVSVISGVTATDVQGAIAEHQTDIEARVVGPASSVDNVVATFDSTTGKVIQANSPVTISDAGAIAGLTKVDVDNLTLDGSTLSSSAALNLTGGSGNPVNAITALAHTKPERLALQSDTVSGADQALTVLSPITRFTNSSLTSLATIVYAADGERITLVNATGNTITIKNEGTGTAANRILTGTGADLTLADDASVSLIYDTTEQRWRVVGGSGSGSGSTSNYVTNSDAEAGTAGYATYADAAGVNPVDATGGSPSITLTASSSSPLFGTKSFLLSKGATNRQGDGVSYDYTLSAGDATQVLSLTMPYSTTTNYADGDVRVGIYDVTNAQIIEGTQRDLAANANGFYSSAFQMPSNSTSFRIFWHVSSTNASAYDIKFDNVVLEKKPIVKGAFISDPIAFTPVATWTTNTTSTGYYTREGAYAYIVYNLDLAGAPDAVALTLNMPTGLVVDETKTIGAANPDCNVVLVDASVSRYLGQARFNSSTNIGIRYLDDSAVSIAEAGNVTNSAPFTWASGDSVELRVRVPIVGWSSNVVLSEDTGNRVVAFSASLSGSQTIAPNNSDIKININQIGYDKTGSFDTSNYRYVIPESGVYTFTGTISLSSTNVLSDRYRLRLFKNGTFFINGQDDLKSAGISFVMQSTWTYEFSKGDYVEMYFYGNGNNSVSTLTVTSTATALNGYKIQTPQSIGQSEAVNCKYVCSTGLNLSSSGTTYFLDFATMQYDTHDAVLGEGSGIVSTTNTGWRFVCPQAGVYSVSSAIRFVSSAAWASGEGARLDVYKNGSVQNEIDYKDSLITTGSPSMVLTGTTDVKCNKGDYLEIGATQSSGGALALNGIGTLNYVAIKKVG